MGDLTSGTPPPYDDIAFPETRPDNASDALLGNTQNPASQIVIILFYSENLYKRSWATRYYVVR